MPIQSYLMMYFAGSGWQYGKRKISAMSNQEFNDLTPQALLQQHSDELKDVLPTLEKTLDDVTPLIGTLIAQYGDFIREAIKAVPEFAGNVFGEQAGSNLESNLSGFNEILKTISGMLPTMPEADARLVTAAIVATPPSAPYVAPATLSQETIDRLDAHEIELAMKASAELAESGGLGNIEPQLALGAGAPRKAGQSQILERTKLIKEISDQGNFIGTYIHTLATPDSHSSHMADLEYQYTVLADLQQLLVNLLARYYFD